ncbi:MAG: carboxypeptidase regulatory-like domain-containing protein [Chitinophagaceae bacterium]|nr:carboxypeptidase regulatory-like domain-containing protein [Chitinophagaceae bacterium]
MRLLLTFFFIFLASQGYTQTTVSGKVTDAAGKPVAYGSITIVHPETNKILSFKTVDAKGHYTITFKSDLPKVGVKFSLINYEPQTKIIDNKSQTVDFSVNEKPTELENVTIKPPMVYQKGDTIVHDVKQFANANDRTLSDVIKKMPGVEVDESGKIKYQGKDINQFNVEGRDLMQGQYGIIPNSIPYGDVDKFEIIQNNQPVKMLKDKVPSENAGVNITLKKGVSITGSGSAGVGLSPFLWNAKITPMLLTKKQQALVSLKSNNTGEDVAGDLGMIMFSSGFEGFTMEAPTGSFLGTASVSPPGQIDRQRYWFNQSHAVSANVLIPARKDWEIKSNTTFTDHDLTLTGNRETSVTTIGPDGKPLTIAYTRSSEDLSHQQKLKSTLTFNRNTLNNFFRNNLIFTWNKARENTHLFTNSLPSPQHVKGESYNIQNSLSTLLAVDKQKKHTVNLQSFISYISDPQNYTIDSLQSLQFTDPDMQLANSFLQNTHLKSFSASGTVSIGLSVKKWEVRPTLKINYDQDDFASDITTFTTGSAKQYPYPWVNDLRFSKLKTSGDLSIYRKTPKISLSIGLPLAQNNIKATESHAGMDKHLSKLAFEPRTSFQYTINSKFKWNAGAGRGFSFSDVRSLYPGFVFSGLNFSAYDGPIAVRESRFANTGIVYKNVLRNIDANIGYNFSQSVSNVIVGQEINSNGQQILVAREKENRTQSNTIGAAFSKYFTEAASSWQIGFNHAVCKALSLVNEEEIPVRNISNSFNTRIENASLSWLVASYRLSYSAGKRFGAGPETKSRSVTHNAKAVVSPGKIGSFIASYDANQYLISGQHFFNQFLDLSYRYTIGKRKTDIELRWMNILNTKEFQQVIVSSIQTDITRFKLRPSQVMLVVRANLRK